MAEHWDTSYPSVVSGKYTASCRTSHGPVRARIRAYGSSAHGFAARVKLERKVRTGASG